MNKKVKKGLDVGTIVLACIIFLLGAAVLSLTVTKNTDGIPRLFGVTFLDVRTGSMKGTINPGDVAVIAKVKSPEELKGESETGAGDGDIITFWDLIDTDHNGLAERVPNTHRIVSVSGAGDTLMFYTKGDNTDKEDLTARSVNDLIGKYKFRLPGLGYFIRFLQSGWGFFLVIILPLTAFLAYRVVLLVRVVLDMKKQKALAEGNDPEALKAELEVLRVKVASLGGDGGASPPAPDAPEPPPAPENPETPGQPDAPENPETPE